MTFVLLLTTAVGLPEAKPAKPSRMELLEVRKLWDVGRHNAFTDLIRYKGRWFCTFREGTAHVSPDGALRVLTSADGKQWEPAALVRSATADLRDPKLSVTPDGKLMLLGAGALHDKTNGVSHQTYTWFSTDGRAWGDPVAVGDPNYWLWRVVWHKGAGYGVAYECGKIEDARLYRTTDGRAFKRLVAPLDDPLFKKSYPNECGFVFLPDDTCLCLARRDGRPASALLGRAKPPYKEWNWTDLGRRIGGPQMIRLQDGRLLAAVRLYDKKQRTAICSLDAQAGKLTELLALPSSGDTSYPGMVWHGGELWVSYYASHEGKTNVYLARIKISGH